MALWLATLSWVASAQEADDTAEADEVVDDEGEELVVTGTRTRRLKGEAPVAVEVIDRKRIEASGAEDVADVLDQHAGVNVDRGLFGATVRLRGFNAQQVLILVDGQRVVGRKDGTYDFSRIPVDSIERIEIVKGSSSALYGSDAMGGVINIITRQAGKGRQGSLHARIGTLGTLDGSLGYGHRGKRAGWRLDAGWHSNNAQDLDPETPDTDLRGAGQVNLGLSADVSPSEQVKLTAFGSYAVQDARGVELGVRNAVFDVRNVTEDAVGRLTADWSLDEQTTWSNAVGLSVYRDQFVNDQRNAADLDEYQDTRETLLQVTSQLERIQGPHRLSVGAEGFLSTLRSPRLDGDRGQRIRGGVYAQDEWRLARRPRLVVVPGLRLDGDTWFGGALAPKLGVRFDPVDALTVRAAAGVGWRAPSFRELLLSFDNSGAGYRIDGNPDLEPERSRDVSAGLEWAPVDAFSWAVSGWYAETRDLIQIGTLDEVPGFTTFGYVNVSRARIRGVESAIGLAPITWFNLDLSFTLTDAVDLETGNPLEGRPLLQGAGTVQFRVPVRRGTRLTTRAVVTGPRPFYNSLGQPDERVDSDPLALIDVRVAQPIVDAFSVFAGVENLLDAGDAELLQVPPRFVYVGLDARLPSRRR